MNDSSSTPPGQEARAFGQLLPPRTEVESVADCVHWSCLPSGSVSPRGEATSEHQQAAAVQRPAQAWLGKAMSPVDALCCIDCAFWTKHPLQAWALPLTESGGLVNTFL